MDKSNLEILRKKLPANYLKIIQHKTGFSRTYISKVLYGTRENSVILDAAISLAEEVISKKNERIQRLEKLEA